MSRSLFIECKLSVSDNITLFSQIILGWQLDCLLLNLIINDNCIYLRDRFGYSVGRRRWANKV